MYFLKSYDIFVTPNLYFFSITCIIKSSYSRSIKYNWPTIK